LFAKTRVIRKLASKPGFFRSWLPILFVLIIMLGIRLRFINLDKKIYWHDEVYTSLRATGHTMGAVEEQMFVGRVVNAKAILKYQQLDPNLGLKQSLDSMAIEDAQHPPLYFVILRFWIQAFGNTISIIRSLSVLISLLLFPAIYWLCQELFASSSVGSMAIALTAISPINLWLAQDAREYGLWMVMIALTSAALLRALRLKTKSSWVLYALSLILGFYSYLLTGLVAIAHGIYVFILQGFHWNRTTKAFSIAFGIGMIAILPWMLIVIQSFEIIKLSTGWLKNSLPLSTTLQIWLLNASRLFLDFDLKLEHFWVYILIIPIIFLEIYAFYWLFRRTPSKIYLFILTLVGVTALYVLLPDIIQGGQRSVVTRYLMPCYLGMQLAVAYLLVEKISEFRSRSQKFWQIITTIAILLGIASCVVSSQSVTWWHRDVSYHHAEIANILNQKSQPLLISDSFGINTGNLISLSYLLDSEVQYLLLPEVGMHPDRIPQIPQGFSDIFLLNLPDGFRQRFEQKHQGKIMRVTSDLWQYKPTSAAIVFRD
jgi:uncharacterized membrane protein